MRILHFSGKRLIIKLMNRKTAYSYTSMAAKKTAYPKSVFFIVGNEFCERFCYYGMRGKIYFAFESNFV